MQVMANQIYLTSSQVIKSLATFTTMSEAAPACISMLGSLLDPYNLPLVIDSLPTQTVEEIKEHVQLLRKFNPANPTGSYMLNLCQLADYAIARRLLKCWCTEVRIGVCRPSAHEVNPQQKPCPDISLGKSFV